MWPFGRREGRSIENPQVPISSQNIVALLDFGGVSAAGVNVTIDAALGVPAIWAAVNFLSGTLAGLPLHLYRRNGEDGRERVRGGLATLLHDAVNDTMSSFDWRKSVFDQVFTRGRGVSFIERAASGRIINLWPLDNAKLKVVRTDGRKLYQYSDGGRKITYEAGEVIDIPFMLASDGLASRSPVMTGKDTVGLAIALERYASKFFQHGGVPPLALEGPFVTQEGVRLAAAQITEALRKGAQEGRSNILVLPPEHKLTAIGFDPEKGQMVEAQRFIIEQIARLYSLPPTFLQDLTNGTFSNTEQQDLHFVKHTLKRWVEQFEQELNLKLFGRASNRQYVEMNVDGLLRGDFKTRMDGYAKAVQNSILKPNEARQRENLPDDPQGDKLLIQGATVPLGSQPAPGAAPAPLTPPPGDEDDAS